MSFFKELINIVLWFIMILCLGQKPFSTFYKWLKIDKFLHGHAIKNLKNSLDFYSKYKLASNKCELLLFLFEMNTFFAKHKHDNVHKL